MRHAALAAIAALLVSACGGSGTSSSSPAAPPSAPTGATTVTPPAPASSTTSTNSVVTRRTSTTAEGVKQCVASGLALSYLGQNGGLGNGELGFALRNTAAASCRTGGFPGVAFVTSSGQLLPTTPRRSTQDYFGSTPVTLITLSPGQTASFRLTVGHGGANPAGCTTAAGLQVIPPNDTARLRVTIRNGAYECGTATVSPLRPGTTAYP